VLRLVLSAAQVVQPAPALDLEGAPACFPIDALSAVEHMPWATAMEIETPARHWQLLFLEAPDLPVPNMNAVSGIKPLALGWPPLVPVAHHPPGLLQFFLLLLLILLFLGLLLLLPRLLMLLLMMMNAALHYAHRSSLCTCLRGGAIHKVAYQLMHRD